MHMLMMVIGLSLAWAIRWQWTGQGALKKTQPWAERWQAALSAFLFPPLLLVITAIAILRMGPSGQMVMGWEGWLSYGLAISFLAIVVVQGVRLAWEGHQTLRRIQQNPAIDLNGTPARLLPTSALYSARVGYWHPELVVSQGLLDGLDAEYLEAVLVHEQAHALHHDTFWFFWLGWLRRVTVWLPNSDALWQELLLLRELRADQFAAQQVDPLLLAEALLMVVSAPLMQPEFCASFGWAVETEPNATDRLSDRINSLLENPQPIQINRWSFSWLLLAFVPLVVIPFHS
jgi:Zn-dependent protease with chaperone function